MTKTTKHAHRRPSALVAGFAVGCLLAAAASQAAAQTVKAPPLPPGSALVRVQGGMDDNEKSREVRAHHNKTHFKKDFTRDDSQDNGKDNGNGNGKDNGNGNGKK